MTDIATLGLAIESKDVPVAKGRLEQLTGAAGRAEKAAGGLNLKLVALASAAGATVVGLALGVRGAINSADALAKMSQRAGTSVETLSALKHAANLSGVEMGGLGTAMGMLNRNMVELAAGGTNDAAKSLNALGIKATEASGKLRDNLDVMRDVADRFAGMEDGAQKSALAMNIFGRSGAQLIPLLNAGSSGINSMMKEAERLGLVIDSKTARAAELFNDNMTRMQGAVQGMVNKIMVAALPALNNLSETLASPAVAEAAQTLAKVMIAAFDAVVTAVATTTNAIKGFLDWLNGMDGGSAPLANSLLAGDKLNLADRIKMMSANPQSARELYTGFGMEDGRIKLAKAAVSDMGKELGGVAAALDIAADSAGWLGSALEDAARKAQEGWEFARQTFTGFFADIHQGLMTGQTVWQSFGNSAISALDSISRRMIDMVTSQAFSALFGNFGSIMGGAAIPSGGFIPGITGPKLFSAGGYTGDMGVGQPAGIVHGQEFVMNAAATRRNRPLLEAMNSGAPANSNGGYIDVQVTTTVVNGNLVPTIVRVSGEVAGQKIKQEAPAAVAAAQRNRSF